MDDLVPYAAAVTTVYTVVSLIRFLYGRDWARAGTIVTVWVSGTVVLWLFSLSVWAEGITGGMLGDKSLAQLNFVSIVILGLQIGSTATAFNEVRGAIDRDGHTDKPHLFTSTTRAA